MIVPLLFLIISGQALAFHVKVPISKTCAENPITPIPVSDLTELSGEWYGLYYWYNIRNLAIKLTQCPKVEVFIATKEDIEEQKATCQSIAQTDFDFDKVEIIAQVLEEKILIAKGDEYANSLHYCTYVGRQQFFKVTDDVVLISTPEGGGMKNLLARNVPSEEELECIIDNIEGLDGYVGHPFC